MSVIIPVHNAAHFIERAIASVKVQEVVCEIILINDNSTDGSEEIIAESASYDPRIKVFETHGEQPQGAAVARNIGLSKVQAPFISFLDADDYYLPNRFQHTQSIFSENTGITAVVESVDMEDEFGLNAGSCAQEQKVGISLALDFFRFNNRGPHLNGLTISRDVIQCMKFDEELFYTQDTLFFTQLFLTQQVSGPFDSTPVAKYCIHGENGIFNLEARKKIDPILGKKILNQISSSQPYSIHFYLFKRSLVRQCSKRSKWRFFRYLCYVKHAATIFIRYPILFPATFLRAYLLDKGQP